MTSVSISRNAHDTRGRAHAQMMPGRPPQRIRAWLTEDAVSALTKAKTIAYEPPAPDIGLQTPMHAGCRRSASPHRRAGVAHGGMSAVTWELRGQLPRVASLSARITRGDAMSSADRQF